MNNDMERRLGVLGGTFDPVHWGHLSLAEHARTQLRLERVLWVPTGDPWRKRDIVVTPARHREAMVRLAIEGTDEYQLSTVELEREGPSYSVETLGAIREEFPEFELYFLVGLDALLDLPNWHEPAELVRLTRFGVAERGEEKPTVEDLDELVPGLGLRVTWIEMPTVDISGTELRRRAAQGESLAGAVPGLVGKYIREHELYRE